MLFICSIYHVMSKDLIKSWNTQIYTTLHILHTSKPHNLCSQRLYFQRENHQNSLVHWKCSSFGSLSCQTCRTAVQALYRSNVKIYLVCAISIASQRREKRAKFLFLWWMKMTQHGRERNCRSFEKKVLIVRIRNNNERRSPQWGAHKREYRARCWWRKIGEHAEWTQKKESVVFRLSSLCCAWTSSLSRRQMALKHFWNSFLSSCLIRILTMTTSTRVEGDPKK